MGILSGFKKCKKYLKTENGYQLLSGWTNAGSVEFDDGDTLVTKSKNILKYFTNDSTGEITAGGKVKIWTDKQGGNVQILSPTGQKWEIDASDNNKLRIFTYGSASNGNVVKSIVINEAGHIGDAEDNWLNEKQNASTAITKSNISSQKVSYANDAGDAATLNDYARQTSGATKVWKTIPIIDNNGVTELGRYLDFHSTDNSTSDRDVRITASTSGLSISGTTTGKFKGTFEGDIKGNADTATKLATARTLQADLGNTSAVSFNGSSNIKLGVTGTLPIANGGTGATTAAGALKNLGLTATASEFNVLDGIKVTTTELNYVDGVTSNIQTQLNSKASTSHNHDNRYFTETEITNLLAKKQDVGTVVTDNISAQIINPWGLACGEVGGEYGFLDLYYNKELQTSIYPKDMNTTMFNVGGEAGGGILNVVGTIRENGTNVSLEGHTHNDKQDVSTAINTSNISFQSVKYATTAGNCTPLTDGTSHIYPGGIMVGQNKTGEDSNFGFVDLYYDKELACSIYPESTNRTGLRIGNGTITNGRLSLIGRLFMNDCIEMNGQAIYLRYTKGDSISDGGSYIIANEADLDIVNENTSTTGEVNSDTGHAINLRCTKSVNVQLSSDVDVYLPVVASLFVEKSSIRYKENIEDMDNDTAKKILSIRPVKFDYTNKKNGTNCLGMIAEEVAEIEEYPVYRKDGEIDGLDYSKFVPQIIKMIQIQQQEIEELKSMIYQK